MSNDVLLTKEGYDKLTAELEHLKAVERQRVSEAIREARSHGDLKENAAYHEAKLNQQRLDGRIAELDHVLQMAEIVESSQRSGNGAQLGSTVTVKDLGFGDEIQMRLVGDFEADPSQDMISISSPLGSALIGKEVGDEFEYEAPAGVQKYKVLSIDG